MQEQPTTGDYKTLNWVKYQPFMDGDPDCFVSDDDPNFALVVARGQTYAQLICGLGTRHPNARVSFFGFDNNDPIVAYFTNTSPYNQWKSTGKGGKDVEPSDTGAMVASDQGLNLVFYFPTLDAGETAEFDYVYTLGGDLSMCHINGCSAMICPCD